MPGLQRYLPNYNRELLRWTRVAGPQGGMVLAPVKPDGGDPDPITQLEPLVVRDTLVDRDLARNAPEHDVLVLLAGRPLVELEADLPVDALIGDVLGMPVGSGA